MEVILHQLIPAGLVHLIAPLTLMAVGIFIETKYVSRVALFTNAAALFVFYYPINMPELLGWIVNTIIVLGIIGGVARVANIHLPTAFYKIGWIGSSFVTGILFVYGLSLL